VPEHLDKSAQRIRSMFGQIAPRYDLANHVLSLNTDRYWRWRTVRRVPPRDRRPVLDVCTGTGDLALAYARAARRLGAEVVGTDFCPEMIALARQKAHRAGLAGQVRFLVADTLALPFESDRFQVVTVAFGIRNVADLQRGLAEMTRVCGPGGQVAVLEFSLPRGRLWGGLYRWYFKHVLPRLGQLIARNRFDAYHYLPASVEQFTPPEEMCRRMEQTGLIHVQAVPLTGGVATLYVGSKPQDRKDTPR